MQHRPSESHPGRDPDGPRPPSPDPSAVAASLERIRAGVHRWLDRIEELSRAVPVADGEAEEERAALLADLERRGREWDARFEALEDDRRLLAEAWERLEREQIATLSRARPADEPTRAARPLAPPLTTTSRIDPEAVDRAIIRQFEALRKDVRRSAEAGGVPRP